MTDNIEDDAALRPYLISKVGGDQTFEIGLEPGWPVALAFSFDDAHTVATALNRDRLVSVSDKELCAAYKGGEGTGPLADAFCNELERRGVDI